MKLTLLGTGLLGYSLAERILQSGLSLTVYNRTPNKAKPLAKLGANIATSPAGAISESECILLMLSDAKAIEEVLFGSGGISFREKTVIQMGTIAPAESISIQKKVYQRDGEYLECPVLGSRKEAQSGELILMVGSTKDKFAKWEGLLKNFGSQPRHIGEVGKAAALKLALNQLIAAHVLSFSVSLGIVEKYGVDVNNFSAILKESALYAPMYEKKLNNWVKRDYSNPNFSTKHLLKDVELVLNAAKDKGISTETLEATRKILFQAVAGGLENMDYSSVFNIVNKV